MHSQIRLAAYQGRLQRTPASTLQHSAAYYMLLWQNQVENAQRDRENEREANQLRYALMISQRADIETLFPDLVAAASASAQAEDGAEPEIETPGPGETIIYKFTEKLTEEEILSDLAQYQFEDPDEDNVWSVAGGNLYG